MCEYIYTSKRLEEYISKSERSNPETKLICDLNFILFFAALIQYNFDNEHIFYVEKMINVILRHAAQG